MHLPLLKLFTCFETLLKNTAFLRISNKQIWSLMTGAKHLDKLIHYVKLPGGIRVHNL